MRAPTVLLAFLAAASVAASAPALAQDTDSPAGGQGNPYEVIVNLGPDGVDLQENEFARGDWVQLSVFNGDDVNHTLTVEGKDISLTLPPDDTNDTRPFQLSSVGRVTLKDSPTGDTADLVVVEEASFTGSSSGSKGGPAVGPVVVLGALVALAAVLRRRA